MMKNAAATIHPVIGLIGKFTPAFASVRKVSITTSDEKIPGKTIDKIVVSIR